MNQFFTASFIRATVQRATAGALPTRSRDEWAIYQQDLEISRELAQTNTHANQEIRRLETIHCPCQAQPRTA